MKTFILSTFLFAPSLLILADDNIFANAFGLLYFVAVIILLNKTAWGKRMIRKLYRLTLRMERLCD